MAWETTVTPASRGWGGPVVSQTGFDMAGRAISAFGASDASKTAAMGNMAQAQGNKYEAQNLRRAADFTLDQKTFEKTNFNLQSFQLERSLYQQMGEQEAAIAANGFADSGSAIYLAMDASRQGAVARAQLSQQHQIDLMGFDEQRRSYLLQEKASKEVARANEKAARANRKQAKKEKASGILSAIGSVAAFAGFLSDRRLKRDVTRIGEYPSGLPRYRFRFKGSEEWREGVMADEAAAFFPDAVREHTNGYLMVDYSQLR